MWYTELQNWWVQNGILFLATFAGSFGLYILNKTHAKQPFSLFVAINIKVDTTARPIVVLIDMIISSLIGSSIVFFLTNPTLPVQAVVAGLGMTGLLAAGAR